MATRKDLLKAHAFTSQRLVNALVSRNPDDPQPPLRRIRTATLVGALVATLITAGFGVWGLLDPGANKRWKQGSDVAIVDKTSGVSYVYDAETGLLHPTPNVTSARLAAGSPAVMQLSGASLVDEPRGAPVGIRDAPAVLPAEESLKTFPLRACSGQPVADGARPTTLEFGAPAPAAPTAPLLLVTRAGDLVLVLEGVAHLLPGHRFNPPAYLTERDYIPLRASDAFINALPLGVPLHPIEVAGQGEPSPQVTSLRIGSIGRTEAPDGAQQWWILQRDGYSRITELDAMILLDRGAVAIPNLTIAAVNAALSSQSELNNGDIPRRLPAAPARLTPDSAVCATWTRSDAAPVITVRDADLPRVTGQVRPDSGLADLVVVPPGRGALIQNADIADARGASALVVNGLRYPIDAEPSRVALGYQGAPVRVPPQVLAMVPSGLPSGVVLSRAAASHPLA